MAEKTIEVCAHQCPKRYGSDEQHTQRIQKRQAELGNTVVVSDTCLRVCSVIGIAHPDEAIVNVRVSGGGLTRESGVILDMPDGRLKTVLLKDAQTKPPQPMTQAV